MDELETARLEMVEAQLRRRGLTDARLLAAFREVPRHLFVSQRLYRAAYDDMPLPIGHDQTISQPYIVGLMITLLDLQGGERILEVGTGSGYQAAILSRMAAEVHTMELVPELGAEAARLLAGLGYNNVHVHIGDGTLGWPDAAPYHGIIGAAAAPQVPPPLLAQLAEGARLVLPVATEHEQLLKLYIRHGNDYDERVIAPVAFVPMRGKHGW
jgi:protein-L-isoaspartate(D-aspartate) O-methyltransferase